MSTSAPSFDLPKTPQSAPPNFYSQVGQGQGASKGASKDKDTEFLESVTKLLNVLGKMGKLEPRGMDVSKYTQAAADALKECVKHVFNQDMGQDVAGSDAQAADAGSSPAGGAAADTSSASGAAGAAGAPGAA